MYEVYRPCQPPTNKNNSFHDGDFDAPLKLIQLHTRKQSEDFFRVLTTTRHSQETVKTLRMPIAKVTADDDDDADKNGDVTIATSYLIEVRGCKNDDSFEDHGDDDDDVMTRTRKDIRIDTWMQERAILPASPPGSKGLQSWLHA